MKRVVLVTISTMVEVQVREELFTEEWLAEWRRAFYPFHTVNDHIEHIAQLAARDMLSETFTEGYGPLADMGISARTVDWSQETEIQRAEEERQDTRR